LINTDLNLKQTTWFTS